MTNTSSSTTKLSKDEAKKKTQSITSSIGKDEKSRNDFMTKAKAQGISWKENDNVGINWMRCCMAINSHFENGGSWDTDVKSTSKDVTDTKKSNEVINLTNDSNTVTSDMVTDGAKFTFTSNVKDSFKSNGLNDVMHNISKHLEVGDEIVVSRGDTYNTSFVISAVYSNGNREYVPVHAKGYSKVTEGKKYIKEKHSRSWKDITQGSAWLSFSGDFNITVNKGTYNK